MWSDAYNSKIKKLKIYNIKYKYLIMHIITIVGQIQQFEMQLI